MRASRPASRHLDAPSRRPFGAAPPPPAAVFLGRRRTGRWLPARTPGSLNRPAGCGQASSCQPPPDSRRSPRRAAHRRLPAAACNLAPRPETQPAAFRSAGNLEADGKNVLAYVTTRQHRNTAAAVRGGVQLCRQGKGSHADAAQLPTPIQIFRTRARPACPTRWSMQAWQKRQAQEVEIGARRNEPPAATGSPTVVRQRRRC